MAAQGVSSRELRETARYLEDTALDALASYADITFPLSVGNARFFPRERPEDQVAQRGVAVLQESIEQVVASLYALAAALDNNLAVPPALLVSVQPYIDAFRATQKRPAP